MIRGMTERMMEITFTSARGHERPFADIELDVIFTGPDGGARTVPGFWAGGDDWKVRFAPGVEGRHRYETRCSDKTDDGLHGTAGEFEVAPYEGENPLLLHGRLRASDDRRYLAHSDGTPFFWLGDTWWMGLCKRLSWPEDFQELARDRVDKGFNAIQIVAGLYPDVPPDLDPRGANEAGFPLSRDFSEINPAYFDMADLRIAHLVRVGLMPVIVGCWGYWILVLGPEKMKRFWRYLVARWGAWPVVWCLAGEGEMPYYLSETKDEDRAAQRRDWTELARYVRSIDGHHNVITIHPTRFGREQIEDPSLLDFDMLQTGHQGYESLASNVDCVVKSVAKEPRMPVLVGEVNYEGILGYAWQDVQRFCFWTAVLSGSCGFTYGANGIWQVNEPGKPFGPSPHGRSWGDMPWREAARLPGSGQLGAAAKFLRGLEWWNIEPHPEWVAKPWTKDNRRGLYAAGIPGKLRVIYNPRQWDVPGLTGIERDVKYTATYFDPLTGEETDAGPVEPDEGGNWTPPRAEVTHDWVIVLKSG